MLTRQQLTDRQGLAVGFQRLVWTARGALEVPDVEVACGQVPLELDDAGVLARSRLRVARALPCDSSAWSGWPMALWRFPMLFWPAARALWNSVTLGFSRQPLPNRQGLAAGFQRLVRMARGALEEPDVVMACGQIVLELSDAGVLAQPLPDRQGLIVRLAPWSGWPVALSMLPRQYSIVARPD